MNWFSIVTQNVSKIPDAILHYEAELEHASKEVKLQGNIEKQSASMPGVVEARFRQLQEIEGILKHLEIQARRLKTKHYKKYLENYQRALTSRDAEKYAEGEDEARAKSYFSNSLLIAKEVEGNLFPISVPL